MTHPVQAIKVQSEAMKKLARMVIQRHKDMSSGRVNWDTLWNDVAQFVIPNKDSIYDHHNRATGDRKHHRIYEGSAIHFNEMLANTLHSMMTSPSEVFIEFHARNKAINQRPASRKWLQDLAEAMIQLLNNTNFQSQIHEVYMDLGSFGTGVMGIFEDDETVLRFESKPIFQFQIDENPEGVVDTISTLFKMGNHIAIDKYGKEVFGDKVEKMLKKPNDKITIIQMIMPRKKADRLGFGAKGHAFASIHVCEEMGLVLRESGFKEFPYVVPRWIKLSDEKYGRSPSMKALPDIKMINAIMKTTIRGAQKVVDPTLLIPDDGVLGRINTRPGGLITYRAGSGDEIKPLLTGGQPLIGVDIMKDVRERIEKHFFIDQMTLKDGPQMTATEVNARMELQLRLLGPILGRVTNELLQPMVGRLLSIMTRKNLLPPDPPAEFLNGPLDIEVFFTSQIAKAQRSAEANDLVQFLTTVQPIMEVFPEAADVLDIDATIRKIGRLRGVTEDIFNTDEQIEEKRTAAAEQEAAKQQVETELAGAEILNKGAKPMQELGLLQGGQGG